MKTIKPRPGRRAPPGDDPSRYQRPSVACDVVIIRFVGGRLEVLLIERGHDPYQGSWALPGGFVNIDESLESAAAREVEEETSIRGLALIPLGAFGAPDRDPRTRVISSVYLALVRKEKAVARAGDDARAAQWFSLFRPPALAFDHAEILIEARKRLREIAVMTPRIFELLPRAFHWRDFMKLSSGIMGRGYDASAFFQAMAKTPGFIAVEDRGPGSGYYRYQRSGFHLGDFMFMLLK